MEQLLNKYVYLQCTKEEELYVHTYIETDFSRCFEVIRLMKIRAYNELYPSSLREIEPCYQERKIRPIPASPEALPIPQVQKSRPLGGLFGFLTRRKKDEEIFESGMMHEKPIVQPMDECVSVLDLEPEIESVSASGFLDMLKTYVDLSD